MTLSLSFYIDLLLHVSSYEGWLKLQTIILSRNIQNRFKRGQERAASTAYRVIISSIIDKNTYLIGIDTTTNKNARYVIAYPNESLIEMKIRCDLMDFSEK